MENFNYLEQVIFCLEPQLEYIFPCAQITWEKNDKFILLSVLEYGKLVTQIIIGWKNDLDDYKNGETPAYLVNEKRTNKHDLDTHTDNILDLLRNYLYEPAD